MEITREYREKQMELLDLFTNCCEQNHIPYYLNGGTLLGAVRHEGFIPWDDDMDVAVFRADYERLLQCLKAEIKEPFVLQIPEEMQEVYWGGFMRIRNANTTAAHMHEIIDGPDELCNGIWLDIQILDNVYENPFRRWIYLSRLRYWKGLRMAKSFYGKYKENWCVRKGYWMILKCISKRYSNYVIDEKISKIQGECKVTTSVASLALHKSNKQTIIRKSEWFGEGVKLRFEGMEVNAPQNYKADLEVMYGSDYMVPPKDAEKNGHGIIMDANRPYTCYRNLSCPGRWKNETKGKTFVLFGSGQQANYFIEHEDERYMPKYIVDNNSAKWGTTLHDIPIISPQELCEMNKADLRVIIANIYWKEISVQLDEMGIYDYHSYVNSAAWDDKGKQA